MDVAHKHHSLHTGLSLENIFTHKHVHAYAQTTVTCVLERRKGLYSFWKLFAASMPLKVQSPQARPARFKKNKKNFDHLSVGRPIILSRHCAHTVLAVGWQGPQLRDVGQPKPDYGTPAPAGEARIRVEGSGSRSVKDFGLLVFVLNAPSSLVTHDTRGATCAPKAAPTTVPFLKIIQIFCRSQGVWFS